MAERFYRRSKGFPFVDHLTAAQAAQVLAEAKATDYGAVEGDLETGFRYWVSWHETTGPITRARVFPVAPEQVPEAERLVLDAGRWVVGYGRDGDGA